jgi:hypothetical protein
VFDPNEPFRHSIEGSDRLQLISARPLRKPKGLAPVVTKYLFISGIFGNFHLSAPRPQLIFRK